MGEAMQLLMDGNNWPLDTASFRETKRETPPYEHLANIGDCFVFADSGKYYGILLYEIGKTAEGIDYDFIVQPNTYPTVPNFNDFKKQGFFGTAIPNGMTKRRELAFSSFGFLENDFEKNFPSLQLVGHINLSGREDRVGSQSVPNSLTELAQSIVGHKKLMEKPVTKTGFLDGPRDTAFSFSLLKTSVDIGEKKEPHFTWTLSKKSAHPAALKFMQDDYWWQQAYDFAPFGSDDGNDALYGFREWRLSHPAEEPANYLDEMVESWQASLQQKDWTDYALIKKRHEEDIMYTSVDYAIVGVAFAQLVLEGKISTALKNYGIKAVKRQQLLTEKGDYGYTGTLKKDRLETWARQLKVLEKAPV